MAIDYGTQLGKVRFLAGDTDESNPFLSDNQVNAALSIESNNTKRAAAACLESIASSQALLLKVIKALDITTDGAKMAADLRAQAQRYRAQATEDEASEEGGSFDIAENVFDDFSYRETLIKAYQED